MSLESLKKQRANTKKNISRIKNIIEANGRGEGEPLTSIELKCRMGIADSYFEQALQYQSKIETLDAEDTGRAELEDLYVTLKLSAQQQITDESYNGTLPNTTLLSSTFHAKLPALKLPTFSGQYADYKNFIVSFRQIIDREVGLTNIEKFNHLRNCLEGPALETVKAFQITNENYPKALERLRLRYDNNTLIFMDNIATLFQLPSVAKQNHSQLRSLLDNASALYSSLSSLGKPEDISNAMLIYIIMEKVDVETRNKWKESLDYLSLPTWRDCCNLLERHCQYLQSIHAESINVDVKKGENKSLKRNQGFSFALTARSCQLCTTTDHSISNCPRFKEMDNTARFDTVKKHSLCVNCLSPRHQVSQCTSKFKCRICSKLHHTLLHNQRPTSQAASADQLAGVSQSSTQCHQVTSQHHPQVSKCQPDNSSTESSIMQSNKPVQDEVGNSAFTHTHLQRSSAEQVILATAMILVRNASGEYLPGRALLDSCSQVNFITDKYAQKLRLPRDKQNVEILSIGESLTNIKYKTSSIIKSQHTNYETPLEFCVISHISYQPDTEIDISSWDLPRNILLADDKFHKPRRIDLLIGTDTFFELISIGQIKLGPNMPILQKTLLGWIVSGRCKQSSPTHRPTTCLLSVEESINAKLEQLWALEDVARNPSPWTTDQQACETYFLNTVTRNSEGRVVVRLPFKEFPASLGGSYGIAMRRFIAQERRIARQDDIQGQYQAFMTEFQQLGHMTRVQYPNLEQPHCYVPHHCVLKPSSTSTKLRVVFDASCKTTNQNSLNDLLMVGPTIQSDLFTLLLNFRLFRYVITADIVKMYRQVLVHEEDQRFQYILWRNAQNNEVETFKINTVTYGTAAAPFLAVRALHYLADEYRHLFPLGAQVIKQAFYVDDFIYGADCLARLTQIKNEVTEILQRGCLELAKWHSNLPNFVEDKTVKDFNLEDAFITSALGITWDQKCDVFLFSLNVDTQIDTKVTKRSILSIASSLFDPLGLLAPLIIRAKILLQELWLLKLNWDESVPQTLHTAWQTFLADLNALPSIKIPRYCLAPTTQDIQLHGFCDASLRAYGCCLYLRVEDTCGNVSVNLLTVKSRVAPTKRKSLPKLELCAAALLANLYDSTKSSWKQFTSKSYLWTDSEIVLHWLKQHSSTLSVFVGNRVADIQEISSECQWRHVSTTCNPADIVSRGCTVAELKSSLWFSGPSFLQLSESYWPENKYPHPSNEDLIKETRKSVFHAAFPSNPVLEVIERRSSYIKILRIIAWSLRFVNISRSLTSNRSRCLTPDELLKALWCIVWNIQQQYFAEDIRRIERGQTAAGSLKALNPFLQEYLGFPILRVGGRLELADIPDSQKHPAHLPNCTFTKRLVQHLHLSNYHAGAKALVALIRDNFWIVNARDVTRQTVRSCIHCVRYKPKLLGQIMGNLPNARVSPCHPFERCAVDFCGPINTYLRIRGKPPVKTYVAVFVCMATKAVHIEVVSELTTDAFIAALKRLLGRRGQVTDIFCDNATNFIGANNKLAELKALLVNKTNQDTIVNFCTNSFINFQFIPSRAPHFGGLWEAAIKSAKSHLNRTLMNTRLTYEELSTAMVEIEAILNSRPISPLSSDPSDLAALTPGHLIIGRSLKALPERHIHCKDIEHLARWDRITAIKQRFWQQWSKDYLNELQCRTKWADKSPNLISNSMVIIHEDNMPPQKWRMGRVINCIAGHDKQVRVADIHTSRGVIRRPVHKLAILPA